MAKKFLTFDEKYELVGVEPGTHYVAGFGLTNLKDLDIEEADHLYNAKFPFLKLKDQSAKAAATT